MAKILIWKLFTTAQQRWRNLKCCFRYGKDTNLKAIHNERSATVGGRYVVSDMAKILIWKLFTTVLLLMYSWVRCFRYGKDTNLKAIHNEETELLSRQKYGKDTNLKAIHNMRSLPLLSPAVVSDMAKILIWKLFTTKAASFVVSTGCFRYGKDTNLKAIHN